MYYPALSRAQPEVENFYAELRKGMQTRRSWIHCVTKTGESMGRKCGKKEKKCSRGTKNGEARKHSVEKLNLGTHLRWA